MTIIADYGKCYERISLDTLRDKFLERGVQRGFVQLARRARRAPRILGQQSHPSSEPLFPDLGLPAGDAFCDISAQVWAVLEFDAFAGGRPWMTPRSYIDYNSMRVSSNGEERVADMAVEVFGHFQDCSDDLGAKLNDMLAIVVTSRKLAQRVARGAGLPDAVAKTSAIYVGADFAEARARAAPGAGAERISREREMIPRVCKARKFGRILAGLGTGACRKVIEMGVAPEACYGAEMAGLDDAEWAKMRATIAGGQLPAHGGVSE